MAFSNEMRRQGRTPGSRVLAREIRPATDAEARALAIRPLDPVVLVRRLRLADDLPVAVEHAVLVRRTADVVMAADLETGSLHEALARAGLQLRRGQATITSEGATIDDAQLLGVREGEPLLVERRVIADVAGRHRGPWLAHRRGSGIDDDSPERGRRRGNGAGGRRDRRYDLRAGAIQRLTAPCARCSGFGPVQWCTGGR